MVRPPEDRDRLSELDQLPVDPEKNLVLADIILTVAMGRGSVKAVSVVLEPLDSTSHSRGSGEEAV